MHKKDKFGVKVRVKAIKDFGPIKEGAIGTVVKKQGYFIRVRWDEDSLPEWPCTPYEIDRLSVKETAEESLNKLKKEGGDRE